MRRSTRRRSSRPTALAVEPVKGARFEGERTAPSLTVRDDRVKGHTTSHVGDLVGCESVVERDVDEAGEPDEHRLPRLDEAVRVRGAAPGARVVRERPGVRVGTDDGRARGRRPRPRRERESPEGEHRNRSRIQQPTPGGRGAREPFRLDGLDGDGNGIDATPPPPRDLTPTGEGEQHQDEAGNREVDRSGQPVERATGPGNDEPLAAQDRGLGHGGRVVLAPIVAAQGDPSVRDGDDPVIDVRAEDSALVQHGVTDGVIGPLSRHDEIARVQARLHRRAVYDRVACPTAELHGPEEEDRGGDGGDAERRAEGTGEDARGHTHGNCSAGREVSLPPGRRAVLRIGALLPATRQLRRGDPPGPASRRSTSACRRPMYLP